MSSAAKCNGCGKGEAEPGSSLKHCAKCGSTKYCSRECQKTDWKEHKKVCAPKADGNAADPSKMAATSSSNASTSRPSPGATSQRQIPPTKNLDTPIEKPFTKLSAKTWLHDRSEKDVFKLLIDAYRLRMEDNYTFTGDVEIDSIYNEAPSGVYGFRRFVHEAEQKAGLLPPWWKPQKVNECVGSAGTTRNDWSNLSHAVEKSDIMEQYGTQDMPMQLRMFAEQVYGTGPVPGQSTTTMMAMKMATGSGHMHSLQTDMSSFMFGQGRDMF